MGTPSSRAVRARSPFPSEKGNCVLAITVVFFVYRGGTLGSNVFAPESIMLATFFVLWPFAAASLFALAKFFDQRDQQLAKIQVVVRRHR
ncbi:hypothetical protein [Paraburkholderia sp. 22B1P]|nr:hypothetical protein PBP221_23540 [Paraburkholderia sp. 22B1P]